MNRKNIHTYTLGCKVNFADTQAITGRLRLNGDVPAALVGTCCVTAEGEKQSRKEVRRAVRRVGPGGSVFVTGCAARLNPGIFEQLAANVVVVTGGPEAAVAEIQMKLEGMSAAEIQMKPEGATAAPAKPGGVATVAGGTVNAPESARTRFFLKVQDGCANRCAYCVIPQVRGKPMSIPAVEVQATAAKMVAAGYPELVVSGINAGVWHDGGMDLAGLMDWLARIDGLKRLRLSSIEVAGLTPELLDVMERHQNIGRHLHLPLQSGDDRVLAAMGRRYDTNVFTAAVASAREAIPGVNLTTDVIVGFPGENEIAFNNTLWLVEDLGFSKVHVFTYSPRPGTVAAAMGDTVPVPVKKRRSRFLRLLSDRLQRVHRQRKLGITSEILLESPLAPGVHGGYSSDYTRFAVEGGDPGMLVRVRGEEISGETVRGKVISD